MWRLLTVLALILSSSAATAPESIYLGTVKLNLGMSRDSVLSKFVADYDLSRISENSWLIVAKGHPADAIGNVGFQGGKLSSVYSYWGPEDQSAAAPFARAMFGVFQQLTEEGNKVCRISVGQKQYPETEMKTAFLVCGAKTVEIQLTIVRGKEGGAVTEILK